MPTQTVVQKAFQRWMSGLATLPLVDFTTSPTEIFHRILPTGNKAEDKEFTELWNSHFDVIDPIARPHQMPTAPGWYAVVSCYARQIVEYMWPYFSGGSIEHGFKDVIEDVVDEWNRIVSRGESDDRDYVPVLVHFTYESEQMPGKLCIDQLSATTYKDVIFLQPVGDRWAITDRRYSPSVFCIYIPGPGTLPFQRAAKVLEKSLEWGCYETALLLEWIFAAGDSDALEVADGCLSHRSGSDGRRIPYTTARRLVRAARGL